MKILLLGLNHSSVMTSMCKGLRENGADCTAISFEHNLNSYSDYNNIEIVFKKNGYSKRDLIIGLLKLFRLVQKADIIHVISNFYTGHSLFQKLIEKKIFSEGKKKFITFTGNDIRVPEIELSLNPYYKYAFFHPLYEGRGHESAKNSDELQRKFFNYGFNVIGNLETLPFINKQYFKDIPVIHHPSANHDSIDQDKQLSSKKIKIIHASTSYYFKGSNFILEAIRELEKRGVDNFEFEYITKISTNEYREKLKSADILIDQMICGWYGISAQQALEYGKVVLVYLQKERLVAMPDCPIVNVNINDLTDVLEDLLSNPAKLKEIGKRGIEFYQKYHTPAAVGKELLKVYSNSLN